MSRFADHPMIHALLLALFGVAAAALLSTGDLLTAKEIEARKREDLARTLDTVVPVALHDNRLLDDIVATRDEAGQPRTVYVARRNGAATAVAFAFDQQGYGRISLIIGIDAQGQVLGVRVLKHEETPGLGDQIEVEKSDWIRGFDGRSLDNTSVREWAVKKDGGLFDQFSGATITPRAVVKGVVQALTFFAANKERLLAPAAASAGREGAGT